MTSDEALTQAQRLIVQMSPEHQQKLIQSINALNQLKGKQLTTESGTPINDWTLNDIVQVLSSKGIEFTTPATLSRRCTSISAYRDKIKAMDGFLSSVPNRVQQRALFRTGIILLCHNLAEMNVPVSGLAIMNHIHRIPALVDRAFPGYARHGLLRMIIRSREEEPKKEKTNARRRTRAR